MCIRPNAQRTIVHKFVSHETKWLSFNNPMHSIVRPTVKNVFTIKWLINTFIVHYITKNKIAFKFNIFGLSISEKINRALSSTSDFFHVLDYTSLLGNR